MSALTIDWPVVELGLCRTLDGVFEEHVCTGMMPSWDWLHAHTTTHTHNTLDIDRNVYILLGKSPWALKHNSVIHRRYIEVPYNVVFKLIQTLITVHAHVHVHVHTWALTHECGIRYVYSTLAVLY